MFLLRKAFENQTVILVLHYLKLDQQFGIRSEHIFSAASKTLDCLPTSHKFSAPSFRPVLNKIYQWISYYTCVGVTSWWVWYQHCKIGRSQVLQRFVIASQILSILSSGTFILLLGTNCNTEAFIYSRPNALRKKCIMGFNNGNSSKQSTSSLK